MFFFLRPSRILFLLLLAGGVAGWWYWNKAGQTSEVGERAALDSLGRAGQARRGLPAPGVYTFRQLGEEQGGLGPLSVDRTLPDRARMVVRRTPDGVEQELNLAKEHIESVRYRRGPRGIQTTWIRTEITFAGFGRDDRRVTRPAPVTFPARLRPGLAWTSDYRTGDIKVRVRSRIIGRDTVEIDDRPEPVFLVRVSSNTSGAHPGTQDETIWWSERHALPLRWELRRDIRGTVKLKVRATLELESLTPAR